MASIYNGSFVLGDTSATTLSAGPGIKLDTSVPGVIGIGTDETVLWSGSIGTNSSATLSEPYTNFERIRVAGLCGATVASNEGYSVDISAQSIHELSLGSFTMNSTGESDGTYNIFEYMPCLFNGTTVTTKAGRYLGYWGAKWQYQTNVNFALKRVIGINRISGGN